MSAPIYDCAACGEPHCSDCQPPSTCDHLTDVFCQEAWDFCARCERESRTGRVVA